MAVPRKSWWIFTVEPIARPNSLLPMSMIPDKALDSPKNVIVDGNVAPMCIAFAVAIPLDGDVTRLPHLDGICRQCPPG